MEQKKICLVYNTSKYLYLHRNALLRTLIEKKYMVYVIAPFDNYSNKLKTQGARLINLHIDRKGMNLFRELYLCYNIFQAYRRIKPDIIHHFTIKPIIYGSIVGWLLGVSSIVNSMNGLGNYWSQNRWKQSIIMFLYKFALYDKNIKCIFQNVDDMNIFLSKSIILPKESIVIESCGIDLIYFNSSKYKTKLKKNRPFRFLFLSRMLFDKGLNELYLASLELYKDKIDFEIILAGEIDPGNPLSAKEDWLETISVTKPVKWVGFIEDTPKLIFDSDVIILPSYREGFSQSLLEALAMSRPIITTDVPGCREFINGNGYLVQPKDITGLKIAMQNIMSSKDKLIKMGRRSRELAIKYDSVSINARTIACY